MDGQDNEIIIAKPFLKWAGGKGQLLTEIGKRFPSGMPTGFLEGEITRYVEPFIGSGAVLFHVLQNYKIDEAYIFDINPELILVYNVIKKDVEALISILREMEDNFLQLDDNSRKIYYYEQRDAFNNDLETFDFENFGNHSIKRASQFIFLNRTCFNGLFRVNKSGLFNVPMGKYKNPTICNEENLRAVNRLLQKVVIRNADYRESENVITNSTFVYLDPPYRPLNASSSFTAYSKYDFQDIHQIELSEFFKKMNDKDAFLMLSNSDPKNTDPEDNFFDNLYQGFKIERVSARRNINSKSTGRGSISELLIRNYQ